MSSGSWQCGSSRERTVQQVCEIASCSMRRSDTAHRIQSAAVCPASSDNARFSTHAERLHTTMRSCARLQVHQKHRLSVRPGFCRDNRINLRSWADHVSLTLSPSAASVTAACRTSMIPSPCSVGSLASAPCCRIGRVLLSCKLPDGMPGQCVLRIPASSSLRCNS